MFGSDFMTDEGYHFQFAAAFIRGCRPDAPDLPDAELVAWGQAQGLRVHRFKRNSLPRVQQVLGWLRGLAPLSLLDIGSGRGTFLWPLIEAFPELAVTAIDADPTRAANLRAVAAGGIDRLTVIEADAATLSLDQTFDGVTLLEVLEHVEDPLLVARSAVSHASRFVIASVPSQPDDNPEHVRFFDGDMLKALLRSAGCRRVTLEWVRGHILAFGSR
jgi:SAM-dependent methyltransferase